MSPIRGLWRLARLLYLIGSGMVEGSQEHIRALASTPSSAEAQARNQDWFRRVLACLNVQVSVHGKLADAPCLVVCNHISWLDILVLGSAAPVVFLSKVEIARWPLISRLARAGGTLFIQRGGEGAARHSIDEMRKAFARRQSVAIFPEGTTGEGRVALPFHPRLFAAAIESGTRVQPVALRYPHSRGVHPKVPYIGRQTLVASILGILGCRSIQAEVTLGPPIDPEGLERRRLADQARAFVVGVLERGLGDPEREH